MPKKKSRIDIKQDNPSLLYIFPIAFVLSVVPIIVFMKVMELTPIEIQNWYGEPYYADFFNYYKTQWFLISTVLAAIIFSIYALVHKVQLRKSFLYIPVLTYAGLIILSTAFSQYPEVALRGFVARYEGMYTLLCYLAIFLITFNFVKNEKQIKFLLGALLLSSLVIGLIGFFQLIGLDIFRTEFGKQLILPKAYSHMTDNIQFRFAESNVFSTLSNPNFVGSYMVLLIPIAFTAFVYFKKAYIKIGAALLTVILAVNLFGSRSRAGLVGLVVVLILGLVFFRRTIFRHKLISIISVVGIIVLFLGMNYALNGVLIDRLVSEFTQINGSDAQFFDLQDIVFEDNSVSIISSTETLVIKNENRKLFLYDEKGNKLDIDWKKGEDTDIITIKDPKYKDYVLNIVGNILVVKQKETRIEFRANRYSYDLIGINGDETKEIEKAEAIGFEGKERLGSARGYIWSRTLPMIKKAPILGYGPDIFAIAFPQNDYIGKIRAYGTAQMIVDKPHNMYLQIAVNTGFLSLLAFLTLSGFYAIQSIRLYLKNIDNSLTCLAGVGIFLGICGYMIAALFNDSVIAVAPIFWVLLGLGSVCNRCVLADGNH